VPLIKNTVMSVPPDIKPDINYSADINYDEKKSLLHKLDSLSLLLYTFLLTLTVVTIWLFKHRRVWFLHETGLAIIYGLIIGAIIRFGVAENDPEITKLNVIAKNSSDAVNVMFESGPPDQLYLGSPANLSHNEFSNKTWVYDFKGEVKDAKESEIDQKATFDPEIFFNIILPPIIFNAGYSMRRKYFFRNIGSIFTFAFIGTTVSAFSVGGIMYGVTRVIPHLNNITLMDTLHFGSLISATDPVTVIAIFNDLHVDQNLYALVFGESVINDAVAIVLAETLKDYEETATSCKVDSCFTAAVFFRAVLDFFLIFGASFLVGSFMGCITALLTKFTHIREHPLLESTLFILMSYSTFLLAEVFELTGIVAVLFCGITQAHYTYNNLSKDSKETTKRFFELLNFMSENFIFSYIGVSMFTFPKHRFDPVFIIGSFVAIIVGRALNIYPLAALLNIGRKVKITAPQQHMLFLSGLRGAIAFALSIRNTISESKQMILSTTILIVIVTVVVNGGSTMSLLKWLGIPFGADNERENEPISTSPLHTYRTVSDEGDPVLGPGQKPEKSLAARGWSSFDNRYLKPLLTHCNPTLMETMPGGCLGLARLLTSSEQLQRHPMMIDRQESSASAEEEGFPDLGNGGLRQDVATQEKEKPNKEFDQKY